MRSIARAISFFLLLLAASPLSAQVINGESTYGDSDLHQRPAEAAPRSDDAARRAERAPPHDAQDMPDRQ